MACSNDRAFDCKPDERDLTLCIAVQIRKLRLQAGYSSATLFAQDHGFNSTSYALWERGTSMTVRSLNRVCFALNITLAEFFAMIKK